MLFQLKSYIKFLWHSKNEHAVHSPFVFNLLTKCFYDKKSKPEYSILKNYRKSLLQNNNFISKLTDSDAENSETNVWLDFSLQCKYINQETFDNLNYKSNEIGKLINYMINNPGKFGCNI